MVSKFNYIIFFSILAITSVQVDAAADSILVDLSLDVETSTSLASNPTLYATAFIYVDLISKSCDAALLDPTVKVDVKVAITDLTTHHSILNKIYVKAVAKAILSVDLTVTAEYDVVVAIMKEFKAQIDASPDLTVDLKAEFDKSCDSIISYLIDSRATEEQSFIDLFAKVSVEVKANIDKLKVQLVANLKLVVKAVNENLVFSLTILGKNLLAQINKLISLLGGSTLDFDLGTCTELIQLQVDTKWTFQAVVNLLIQHSGILVVDLSTFVTNLLTAELTLTTLVATLGSAITLI